MKKKYIVRSKQETVVMSIVFVLFALYALTLIYPFVWTFLNSLKSNQEYFDNPFSLPKDWEFVNYIESFTFLEVKKSNPLYTANMIEMIFNSLWFTVGAAIVGLTVSTFVAYALSKYQFPGRSAIYATAIFVMIIPIVGSMPSFYILVNTLHITNSPFFLITAASGFGFNFIVMYGFFKNISWSYAEAGFIDGAGNWRVFLSIMIPQAKPAIVSLFIIACIGSWNDYMTPLVYLPDFPTLSTGLFLFKATSPTSNDEPVYFAGILVSMIPILILFVLFQETIMSNMVAGGLKG